MRARFSRAAEAWWTRVDELQSKVISQQTLVSYSSASCRTFGLSCLLQLTMLPFLTCAGMEETSAESVTRAVS